MPDLPSQDRSPELTVQQLHTFKQVMEAGGYAAAAKISHLSVPSVWQHIRALEKVYGVKLFGKRGRQVEPTDAAKRLYDAVDEILVRIASTFELAEHSSTRRTLRIVSGVRMLIEDLVEPLSEFQQADGSKVVILHGNNRRAEELLLAGEADLALSLAPGFRQDSPQISYEPAYTVEFIAVCRKSHPFAKSKTPDLRELVKHDLIVTLPGTHGRDALDHALHAAGLQANLAVETDNSGFTIACATSGMGVGILAGRANGELCKKLAVRSLKTELGERQIVFMWRRGRLLPESVLALIETIRASGLPSGD